ncbi:MAG: phosphoribosylaminoimidazolesuccinocarboxamide synthase [Thermoprotei archaeon]|nr:phosphoribosylaminoimidazolesuccinocarboxamide synthase [Thermoprotei archaeon]
MTAQPTYDVTVMPDPFRPGHYVNAIRRSWLLGRERPPRRGKVKDIYDLGGHLLIFHTDRISAFDVVFNDLIPYKGVYLNLLSAYWFKKSAHVFPNHLVNEVDERTIKVIKAERIDIEWIIRGYLYGSAWRAYAKGRRIISGVKLPSGLSLAEELPEPILTPTTKSDQGHDKEISKAEAISHGLVSKEEWSVIEEACFKLYEFYSYEAKKAGIIIPDVKLEFGRYEGYIIQIDEPPTHDSARLWSLKYYEPGRPQEGHCLDKEFLRAYLLKIGYNGEGPPPRLSWPVIQQIALRVRSAYEVLTGLKRIDELPLKGLDEVLKEGIGDEWSS